MRPQCHHHNYMICPSALAIDENNHASMKDSMSDLMIPLSGVVS